MWRHTRLTLNMARFVKRSGALWIWHGFCMCLEVGVFAASRFRANRRLMQEPCQATITPGTLFAGFWYHPWPGPRFLRTAFVYVSFLRKTKGTTPYGVSYRWKL